MAYILHSVSVVATAQSFIELFLSLYSSMLFEAKPVIICENSLHFFLMSDDVTVKYVMSLWTVNDGHKW